MTEDNRRPWNVAFSREWPARFLSQLDLMRSLARTIRRSRLPIYFSEGFNPKPKISYRTPPISLGHTSECERFVFFCVEPFSQSEVASALEGLFTPGLRVKEITDNIAELKPVAMRYEIYLSVPDGVLLSGECREIEKLDKTAELPAGIPFIYTHRLGLDVPLGEGYLKPEVIAKPVVGDLPAHYHRASLIVP